MKRMLILSSLFAFTQICNTGSLFAKPMELSNTAAEVKKADIKTIQVKVTGLTCAGCASGLHKALSKQAGILSNEVKYPGDVAIIKYDAAKISEAEAECAFIQTTTGITLSNAAVAVLNTEFISGLRPLV